MLAVGCSTSRQMALSSQGPLEGSLLDRLGLRLRDGGGLVTQINLSSPYVPIHLLFPFVCASAFVCVCACGISGLFCGMLQSCQSAARGFDGWISALARDYFTAVAEDGGVSLQVNH